MSLINTPPPQPVVGETDLRKGGCRPRGSVSMQAAKLKTGATCFFLKPLKTAGKTKKTKQKKKQHSREDKFFVIWGEE